MFCNAVEKSALLLFSNIPCTDVNLQALPNWVEFLSALDDPTVLIDENKEIPIDCSAVKSSTSHSHGKLLADISGNEKAFPVTDKIFRDCDRLLDLVCWMRDINSRSFSCLVTCIFNLERYTHLSVGYYLMVFCPDRKKELVCIIEVKISTNVELGHSMKKKRMENRVPKSSQVLIAATPMP